MADLRVRNLEDWVAQWHRSQARLHGRSLEGELRLQLTEAALRTRRAIAAEMRDGLAELEGKYGPFPDSAAAIREDRDARG